MMFMLILFALPMRGIVFLIERGKIKNFVNSHAIWTAVNNENIAHCWVKQDIFRTMVSLIEEACTNQVSML